MGEHGCPKHTAYQYVSKLEYIERFDDPSSKTKMCRLKEASRLEVVSENRDDVGDAIANQEDLAKTSYILHLSDLHFGTLENAKIWANQLAADISNDLNIPRLDTIILSGDIANYSTLDEYDAAVQFLNQLTQEFTLQPEQIILVPGNHDLNWQLSKTAYTLKDLSDCQPHELQEGRYISVSDDVVRVRDEERYKQRFAHFSHFYQTIKGHPYPLDYDQQGILHHLPQQSLLILGLNSAWQLDHHYKDRATIHPTALSNALTQIRSNRDQYKDCLKLAVWHHPLDSPWSDRIADQGFLEQLAVNGFRLILHGHIHKAETSLYRYDLSKDGRKLDRICAGTFGAPTRELIPAYPWQYNIIKVEPDRFTIHTRRREEPNGAWKPDSRWTQGAGKGSLDYYVIERSPVPTLTSPITSTSREAEKNEPRGATNINMHFHNKVYGVAGNIEGNLEIPPSASNSDTTDS